MRKSIVLTILIVLMLCNTFFGIGQTSSIENECSIELVFHCSDPQIIDMNEYVLLETISQTSSERVPGHPHLPTITKTIILPFTSTLDSLSLDDQSMEKTMTLDKKIQPVATPQPISSTTNKPIQYIMDETIYGASDPYPKDPLTYSLSTGLKDGKHVTYLTLTWTPYQYKPEQNEIQYTTDLTVKATYTPPIQQTNFPDIYDMVIIAPNQFKHDLDALIQHKNNHDLATYFMSLENIHQQYMGRDEAEQVKYFIKDAVETYGISYVLLVGSIDLTPMRRTAISVHHDNDIITDLYYSDVFDSTGGFSSWDSNNNDLFSEYNWHDGLVEEVDLYPDVAVGRLPCKNNKEVQTMVNKIINYENSASQSSWFHRLLLLGGDTFPYHGVLEGELVTSIISETMSAYGFEPVTLWTSKETFNPKRINQELTKGAGFVSYSGHGYEQGFGTSPPNVDERIEYFSPYLIGVFNNNKLPVVFFDACSTTKLDFNVEELHSWYPTFLVKILTWLEGEPYEMDSFYPCLSWQVVKKINGGGIASIGSTRVAYTGVNANGAHWGAGFLNTHFFDAYQPGSKLSSLLINAQLDYLTTIGKDCITLEEFTLIGDPSLQLGGY